MIDPTPQSEPPRSASESGDDAAPDASTLFVDVPSLPFAAVEPSDVLVDVRTATEFEEDAIPSSRSAPIFDPEERRHIGFLYRSIGTGAAKAFGVDTVSRRVDSFRSSLCEALQLDPDREPGAPAQGGRRVVVCARGGMRSQAVVAFLRGFGHDVLQLEGGYRAYRDRIRTALDAAEIPRPFVLHGLTGTQKTAVLREVAKRFPRRVLDLEGYAGHRSSVLGDIGERPVRQKRFESRLVRALEALEGPWTLIEGEARRIGNLEQPKRVFEQLVGGSSLELTCSLERRLDHLAELYAPEGDVDALRRRIPKLTVYSKLGEDGVREIDSHLAAGDLREAARILLERHYDPRYQNAAGDRESIPIDGDADPATVAARVIELITSTR